MESEHRVVVDHLDDVLDGGEIIVRHLLVGQAKFGYFDDLFKCDHRDLPAHAHVSSRFEEDLDFGEQIADVHDFIGLFFIWNFFDDAVEFMDLLLVVDL